MIHIAHSADGGHASVHESEFLLGWQLNNDSWAFLVFELAENRSVGASGSYVMKGIPWVDLDVVYDGSDWKRSERVSITLLRPHCNSRDKTGCFDEVTRFHVLSRYNVLQLITDTDQGDVSCSTSRFDDLQHFLDLNFAFA